MQLILSDKKQQLSMLKKPIRANPQLTGHVELAEMVVQRAGESHFIERTKMPLAIRSTLVSELHAQGELGETMVSEVCRGALPAGHVTGTN